MDVDHRNRAYAKLPLPDLLVEWAKQVNIELLQARQQQKYELVFEKQKLQLKWLGEEKFTPIFVEMPKSRRIRSTNLLFKAIGRDTQVVHDLTAGLGVDAMSLAAVGKKVYCIERCAPIALLLCDGLRRSPAAISNRIKLDFADSLQWLQQSKSEFETIYIDAMFLSKKKTAKSVKSMQILRTIAGDDADAETLFNQALNTKAKKVVIKHPNNGPVFKEKPTSQYQGKTVRFDVYLRN